MSGAVVFGLLSAFLGGVGCQDGYPIPASQCDEWCAASQSYTCHPNDPAGCVLACNQRGGDAPACRAELDALLDCLRGPSLQGMDCDTWELANSLSIYSPPDPNAVLPSCYHEEVAYELCAVPYAAPGQAWSTLWL